MNLGCFLAPIRYREGRHKGSLAYDLGYQIILTWLYYLRDKDNIPLQHMEMTRHYKKAWNTYEGKASVKIAFRKYLFLCV